MTPERKREIQERCDSALPPSWEYRTEERIRVNTGDRVTRLQIFVPYSSVEHYSIIFGPQDSDIAELEVDCSLKEMPKIFQDTYKFIQHSRDDISDLLIALKEQEDRIVYLESRLQGSREEVQRLHRG